MKREHISKYLVSCSLLQIFDESLPVLANPPHFQLQRHGHESPDFNISHVFNLSFDRFGGRGVQFWQIRLTSGCTDLKHSLS